MKKVKAWIYADENEANAAMVKYISDNVIIDTKWTDFWNDRDVIDFTFFGMKDPEEWYGAINGAQLTNEDGERVIFASWFNPSDDDADPEFDEYFERVMAAFTLFSKPSDKV